MVVSPNKGSPIWTPKYCNPFYGDTKKGTPNLGNYHMMFCCRHGEGPTHYFLSFILQFLVIACCHFAEYGRRALSLFCHCLILFCHRPLSLFVTFCPVLSIFLSFLSVPCHFKSCHHLASTKITKHDTQMTKT